MHLFSKGMIGSAEKLLSLACSVASGFTCEKTAISKIYEKTFSPSKIPSHVSEGNLFLQKVSQLLGDASEMQSISRSLK